MGGDRRLTVGDAGVVVEVPGGGNVGAQGNWGGNGFIGGSFISDC